MTKQYYNPNLFISYAVGTICPFLIAFANFLGANLLMKRNLLSFSESPIIISDRFSLNTFLIKEEKAK